jgi:glycosyltransferase involved in cell wall biosynthesis
VTPKKYRAFEEGWKGRERFYGMLRELSRRASIVITPSAFTRGSLAEECGFPRERMRVIAHAAADVFRPIDDKAGIEDRKKMYRTGDKYILYAGGANWNKNLVRLIDAFDRIKQERKIPHRLIITGDRSWGYSEIMAEARRKGSGDDIIFTGYVPDADLACLYNGAEFFVYPSLLEGFGFSAVEAMACGCPIAASRIPVFEEVIQDAGVFFDPEDMEEMASAMVRMIEDEHLRCELRAKGLVRARCYTWEESAKLTLKAYKDAKAFFVNDNYIRK